VISPLSVPTYIVRAHTIFVLMLYMSTAQAVNGYMGFRGHPETHYSAHELKCRWVSQLYL